MYARVADTEKGTIVSFVRVLGRGSAEDVTTDVDERSLNLMERTPDTPTTTSNSEEKTELVQKTRSSVQAKEHAIASRRSIQQTAMQRCYLVYLGTVQRSPR